MKLDFDSYLKHANHEVVVDRRPVAHNTASLRCARCDKHLKWLSRTELAQIDHIMAKDKSTDYGSPHYGSTGVKTRPVRDTNHD